MVVAQMVEWSLPPPEIRGLNPDIGEILSTNCTIEKTKIKKKRAGMAHLFNKKCLKSWPHDSENQGSSSHFVAFLIRLESTQGKLDDIGEL